MVTEEYPTLKSNVHVMDLGDGAFIGDGRAEILFPGAGLFPVIAKLCSALNGERSLDAIVGTTPARVRPLLDELIGALQRHDMLQRLAPPVVGMADLMASPYRDVLLFLRDREPHFAAAFDRWRRTPLALSGTGYTLKAAARGLACMGIERISLHVVSACEVTENEITLGITDHFESVGRGELQVVDRKGLGTACAEGGLLVHASDHLRLDADFPTPAELSAAGLVLAAGVIDGMGLVVPLRDNADIAAFRGRVRRAQSEPHSMASRSLIGGVAALRALTLSAISSRRIAAGPTLPLLKIGPGGHVTEHDLCSMASQPSATISAFAGRAVARRAALAERAPEADDPFDPLFDPVVGPFAWVTSDPEDQIPLAYRSIDLNIPGRDGPEAARVTGWGRGPTEARADALRRAAVLYAETVERRTALDGHRAIAASPDYAMWRREAFALAAVAAPPFQAGLRAWAIDPESAVDLEVSWYARMARFYGKTEVRAWIGQSSESPGVLAYARAGARETWGAALTYDEALHAALGDLCSSVVRDTPPLGISATSGLDPARRLPALSSQSMVPLADLPPALTVDPTQTGFDRLFSGDVTLALAGLWVGSVSLDETAITAPSDHLR
ncbi:hypothetical protein BH10PSE14_BH10PSE14_04000 [soil metagenome]